VGGPSAPLPRRASTAYIKSRRKEAGEGAWEAWMQGKERNGED